MGTIHEFRKPIKVIVKETMEEAYALYTESGDMYSNDIWTIVLCNGGQILHCTTQQILVEVNKTFGIIKQTDEPTK